jgi:hypothetical protein
MNNDIGMDNSWHVGFLKMMSEIGTLDFDSLLRFKSNAYFHVADVSWDESIMGCKREEWPQLPESYKNNSTEFPLWSVSICYASGQILGLLGEDSKIFYILQITPRQHRHNLWDSGWYPLAENYNIEICNIVESSRAISKCQSMSSCKAKSFCSEVIAKLPYLYFRLDSEINDIYQQQMEDGTLAKNL